jgi:hypothetical protein
VIEDFSGQGNWIQLIQFRHGISPIRGKLNAGRSQEATAAQYI